MKKIIQIDKGHKFTLTQIDLAKVDLTKPKIKVDSMGQVALANQK